MVKRSKKWLIRRVMKPAYILILLVSFSMFFQLRIEAEAVTLSVQPQESRVFGENEVFEINVTVTDVIDLYGWQFRLLYDSALLNVTEISEGRLLKAAGSTYFFNVSDVGRITAGCTLIGNISGVIGTGILATITFRTNSLGNTLLAFADTKLGNSRGEPIAHSIVNGAVEVVEPIHDVAVKNVALSKNEVAPGHTVEVSVLVANEGETSEDFSVNIYGNEIPIGILNVLNLTAGSVRSVIYTWNTAGLSVGNSFQIRAEAIPLVGEIDLSDNAYVNGFLNIVQPRHDVAVVRVVPQYAIVYEGRKVNITIAVANKGDYAESFGVTLYRDNIPITTKNVYDLLYGEERTLDFMWDTTGVGSNRSYVIKAVVSQVPGETSIEDNTLTDGTITILPRISVSMNIAEVVPSDQYGHASSTFARGTLAHFKVTVNCVSIMPEFLLLTVNVYDAQNVSIIVVSFRGFVAVGSTTFVLGSIIPATCSLGNSVVYANALTDWPHLGGTPYCPEKSATFQIRGS